MSIRITVRLFCLLTLSSALLFPQNNGGNLTNADIIALAQAGIPDDIIIARIQAAPGTQFDTGLPALQALTAAHLSNAVIRAMISPHPTLPGGVATYAVSNDPESPHPPGVYLFDSVSQKLSELHRATPKGVKSSGIIVHTFTYGLASVKSRAVLDGAHAAISAAETNPVFYMYIPQSNLSFGGTFSPTDFVLVQFSTKSESRELVESSFNILSAKSGIDDKAKRGFTSEEVKPGIFKLTLNDRLQPGEYAFAQHNFTFFDFGVTAPAAQ